MRTHGEGFTAIDFCLITVLWGVAIGLVLAGLAFRLGIIP